MKLYFVLYLYDKFILINLIYYKLSYLLLHLNSFNYISQCFISSSVVILIISCSTLFWWCYVCLLYSGFGYITPSASSGKEYYFLGFSIFRSAIFFYKRNTPLPGRSIEVNDRTIHTREEVGLLKVFEELVL